jgi:BolA family transcriptional regulator, general stress-responsive regulator
MTILSVDQIREALALLEPSVLDIEDQSEGHVHHAGRGKGGHFKVKIVSQAFAEKKPLQRHQMIYQALGDLMTTHIHAISIDAKAPGE